MRILRYLTLTVLSVAALAAKKAPASIYDDYAKKHASSAPLDLDEKAYKELSNTPRDYTAAILLTALDAKYACGICKDFDSEWNIIARSWKKGDKKGAHRTLFGTLDFDKGRNIFMQVSTRLLP
jgi:oligosaccharyltransferase complex subunit gamma